MIGDKKNENTTKTENNDQEVILLDDLPPKKNVRGGSAKMVFGESSPRRSDGPNRPSASDHNSDSNFPPKKKRG